MLLLLRSSDLGIATTFTLAGPSTGTAGQESDAFTITPNGLFTGTITPADSPSGGAFVPSALTWDDSAESQTFVYVAGFAGVKTITATDDGDLTDPAGVEITIAAAAGTGTGPTEFYVRFTEN